MESSEDESGGESSSSSGHGSYMSLSPPQQAAQPQQAPPHPLCLPFYLLPPSAAPYLPMLEKCWYTGTMPTVLYPSGLAPTPAGGPGERLTPPPPQHMLSPRGGSPAPSIAPPLGGMDSPALLQALKLVPPINLETKD